MSGDLAFACRCGAVRGAILDPGPHEGDRLVCHCTDCQAFARYCDAEDYVLDEHGGTDLYQSRCASVRIDRGAEALACVHLTEKPTLRWYCSQCRTPLFNSFASARVPYITTQLANCDADRRDMAGPVRGHLFVEHARGEPDFGNAAMLPIMLRVIKRIAKDYFSGARRRTALFDKDTLQPVAVPHRLSEAERAALDTKQESAS